MTSRTKKALPLLLALAAGAGAQDLEGRPAAPGAVPGEYGAISWIRDFDQALLEAAATRRPLLLCFQEVPG